MIYRNNCNRSTPEIHVNHSCHVSSNRSGILASPNAWNSLFSSRFEGRNKKSCRTKCSRTIIKWRKKKRNSYEKITRFDVNDGESGKKCCEQNVFTNFYLYQKVNSFKMTTMEANGSPASHTHTKHHQLQFMYLIMRQCACGRFHFAYFFFCMCVLLCCSNEWT